MLFIGHPSNRHSLVGRYDKVMSIASRRFFLAQTAAALSANKLGFARDPLRAGNLGVELYTVRKIIGHDPANVLKAIQDIGYDEVEVTYSMVEQIWQALKQTTLKAVSVHVDKDMLAGDPTHLETVMKDLKDRGFEYVVLSFYQIAEGGIDSVKKAANVMNRAAERAKANGMTFCYHNHAHDLKPVEGTPALELLMRQTQKDLVFLEIDVFWVSVAGHDPVEILKKYSGRVPLLHLKDKAQGVPVAFNENVRRDAFKEVGSGTINMPALLSAADAAGVRHYFVEQDETPGDPIASLRQSYKYLSGQFKS
jgi:sugar phosphate isomerase/epimerase